MAKVFIEENSLTAIGNAIRGKTGESALLSPAAMVTAIEGIETGGGSGNTDIEDKIITGELSGEYTNSRITKIKDSAFNYSYLTSVSFPNVTKIGGSAFESCTKLTSINFPKVIEIGTASFNSCNQLTSAIFPNATTINTSLSGAFSFCARLVFVDLPKVTKIPKSCFNYATRLITLILRKTDAITALENISAFNNTPIKNGTGYIYVPAALLETYKTATNWVTFAAQFRAIEDYPDICG